MAVAILLFTHPNSMTPATFSNAITRGGDWTFGFQAREHGATSPLVDFTDWQFSSTLKTADGAAMTTPSFLLHTPECPVFSLSHTQTALLAKQSGAVFTINAVRPDGAFLVFARGRITIS